MNSKLSNESDGGTAVTQNTSYKKDIAICKRTLEFLEKKQAEYDELYGEDDEEDWDEEGDLDE